MSFGKNLVRQPILADLLSRSTPMLDPHLHSVPLSIFPMAKHSFTDPLIVSCCEWGWWLVVPWLVGIEREKRWPWEEEREM